MRTGHKIIVVGASTGGLEALKIVLGGLPRNFPAILVICQHMDKGSRLDYRRIFADVTSLDLVEVEDKQWIVPGSIYFAPPGYHLYIEAMGYFGLSLDAPVNWSRPSIDVLFESAARAHGGNVIGIILTGANGDGSQGITEIKRLGGLTIAQNPLSALSPVMPHQAIETGCIDHILDIQDIAPFLTRLFKLCT